MRNDYSAWLAAQGYVGNTISTQESHIRQIERCYGDLELLIKDGGLDQIVGEMTYTMDDERAGRPNPSKVDFNGRVYTRLQSLKGGVKRYASFLAETADGAFTPPKDAQAVPETSDPTPEKQRLALEKDMQRALRRDISALDRDLTIIDEGVEFSVESGFIDILCETGAGALVVIELKAGQSDPRVIAQTLGYMGDLMAEDPSRAVHGVIVAHDFDRRTRSAARAISNLKLMTYHVHFSFAEVESAT